MVKISVIVPVYNKEEYLDICLDSLINQGFKDFEVICVNDGSTDSSLAILRKYAELDKRIKVYSKQNEGISCARNFGMKHAKGEYLTFVDSDDFLSPVALEKMYAVMCENKADFMFSYIFQLYGMTGNVLELPPKKEFEMHINKPVFNEQDLNAEFYIKMLSSVCGKMYRRSFIKDIKFLEGTILEENVFFAECWLKAKRISYYLEPLYFYRKQSSVSKSKFAEIFKINKIITEIFEKYGKFEKYKTVLLINQMESVMVKMLESPASDKREVFNLLQETYGNIDFSSYDMEILKRKNVYYAFQKILNKSYRDFRHFESRLKK